MSHNVTQGVLRLPAIDLNSFRMATVQRATVASTFLGSKMQLYALNDWRLESGVEETSHGPHIAVPM